MDIEKDRAEAIAFLKEIEERHNRVLDGLDELNQKIEAVLSDHASSRDALFPGQHLTSNPD